MPWNRLPPELREPIVKYLISSETGKAASYATVCKEWQVWVEQEVFSTVLLDCLGLGKFQKCFNNNLLRQVSLKRLKLYPHRTQSEYLTRETFAKFITCVFGITLGDLNVDFKPCTAVSRIRLASLSELPWSNLVTELEIPRIGNRNLYRQTLYNILKSLPNLERIQIETVAGFAGDLRSVNLAAATSFYPPLWPPSVKRVVFFEHRHAEDWVARPPLFGFQCIGKTFASQSFDLEELVVCNLIEAADFFREALMLQTPKQRPWTNLTLVSLTSEIFGYIIIQDDVVEQLLQEASRAAALMPQLKIMELWNFKSSNAAVFRYHVEDRSATITWMSTWKYFLSPEIMDAWAQVAQRQGFELTVHSETRIVKLQHYFPDAFVFAESNVLTEQLFHHPDSIKLTISNNYGLEGVPDGTWDDTWDNAWGGGSDLGPFRPMSYESESDDLHGDDFGSF